MAQNCIEVDFLMCIEINQRVSTPLPQVLLQLPQELQLAQKAATAENNDWSENATRFFGSNPQGQKRSILFMHQIESKCNRNNEFHDYLKTKGRGNISNT